MSTPHFSILEAKQVDLVEYLEKLGYQPQRIRNNDYWYLSPLRDEKTASFKVNRKLNAWYDHGIGKGGTIIDFGIIYNRCTVSEFLQRLHQTDGTHFSFHPPLLGGLGKLSKKMADEKQSIRVMDVMEIESPALKGYLNERGIPLEIAKKYCKEVRFELYDRQRTAIGFQNDTGGVELRSAYFKGSSSPKFTTLIATEKEYNELSVFEGFFDFLSYQAAIKSPLIQKQLPESQHTFLILNSLSFFEQSRSLMERHRSINLYLDRDQPGIRQTEKALKWNKKFTDCSEVYKGFKDLNDFLTNKPLKPEQGKRLGKMI
jgi:hypothetical protein